MSGHATLSPIAIGPDSNLNGKEIETDLQTSSKVCIWSKVLNFPKKSRRFVFQEFNMNKIIMLLLGLFSATAFCNGQVYTAKTGTASFYSEAPMENIEGISNSVQSIVNTTTKSIAFIISIRSFQFKKDLMQEHFNEKYMESDKFPNATYSGKINEDIDLGKDGTYNVTSSGKIAMHGQEKEITVPGIFTVKNGEATLQTNFPLAVADFKIEIPQLLFQNIADTVAVKVNVSYIPYKK